MSYFDTINADTPVVWWRAKGNSVFLSYGSENLYGLADNIFGATQLYSGVALDAGSYATVGRGNPRAVTLTTSSSWSMELWMFFSGKGETSGATANPWGPTLYLAQFGGGGSNQWRCIQNSSRGLDLQQGANGSTIPFTGELSRSVWHHIAFTIVQGGATAYYVDGSLVGSSTNTYGTAASEAGPTWLVGPPYEQCFVAEIAVYSYILSSGQVSAHYGAADTLVDPVPQSSPLSPACVPT